MLNQGYYQYLKTPYWRTVSEAVKERAGRRCQLCNSSKDLQAHHRTYDHVGRELEFLDDLVCLCADCHEKHHGIGAGRDGMIKLTNRDISACVTNKGGFRRETLEILIGAQEEWPPAKGWKKRLRGKMISVHAYAAAVRSAKA